MAKGRFVLARIGQTLVVTIEGTTDNATLSAAADMISETHARQGAASVVFEVSGCEVMDLDEFVGLQKLVRTMELLGLRCVIAGLRPGIVAYLASAGISAGSLHTSLDLELALQELNPSREQPETESEPESGFKPKYDPDNARAF